MKRMLNKKFTDLTERRNALLRKPNLLDTEGSNLYTKFRSAICNFARVTLVIASIIGVFSISKSVTAVVHFTHLIYKPSEVTSGLRWLNSGVQISRCDY
jgi:hypothetical protein